MFLEIPVLVNLQCSVLTEQWKRAEVLRAASRTRGRYGSVYLGVDVLSVCEAFYVYSCTVETLLKTSLISDQLLLRPHLWNPVEMWLKLCDEKLS